MTTYFDYALSVWIRLDASEEKSVLLRKLRQYLDLQYNVFEIEHLDDDDTEFDSQHSFMLQLQCAFVESEMDDGDPTDDAIDALDKELTAYLQNEFALDYLEVLDDALTSFLLAEREEP